MSKQRARLHPSIRMALAATAGLAVLGVSVAPAQAAAPTPQSLGFPNMSPDWARSPVSPSDCNIASRCRVQAWLSSGNAVVLLQAGYVKGKVQAKYRTAQANTVFAPTLAGHPVVLKKTVTQTYMQRKHQHRLKLRIVGIRAPATLSNPTVYAEHVIGQDSVRVKRGTQGKFAKKIGFADLFMERATHPLPSKLHRKNYRLLGQEMRKLIRTGANYKLTGPAS